MAEASAPKAGKGGLNKKLGPLPVKVWIAVAAGLLFLLYLHYRSKGQSGTSAGSSSQPTPDTSTAGVGGTTDGTGGGGQTIDTSGLDNATTALNTAATNLENFTATLPYYGNYGYGTQPPDGTNGVSGGNVGPAPRAYPSTPATTHTPIPATVANFAQRAVEQTKEGAAAFGGVVSVKRLKNGGTLTTYASGRQVEQAPGKSAYVVHK